MFHAVGLKVMDARERKRDDLDVSTRALKDMIDRQTAHVVVENRPEYVPAERAATSCPLDRAVYSLLRTASSPPERIIITGFFLLMVYSYEMWNNMCVGPVT